MRKPFFTSVTMLGLLLTLAVASVHAQSRATIEATIPFDFTVGERSLEPGQYEVTARNEVELIRSKGTRSAAIRLTNSIRSAEPSARTKLVFHRYGQRYFLSEVWAVDENSGRQLVKSRQERAIEKQIAASSSKTERARTRYARVEILAKLQ